LIRYNANQPPATETAIGGTLTYSKAAAAEAMLAADGVQLLLALQHLANNSK